MILSYGLFVAFTFFIFVVNFLLIIRAWITHKEDKRIDSREPFVSILVPAYNEEKSIVDSINSLLKQEYTHFEIIVVDDGSTDNTLKLLRENFSDNPLVAIFTKENAGKAEALNFAATKAQGLYFMCIDADTILRKDALRTMVTKRKEGYDAVAAMVGIHNGMDMDLDNGQPVSPEVQKRISTRMQFVEYCRSYVAFRCSVKDKNCITVISGACGLISREMFRKCGGYKKDQLGEDMELTMNIHTQGGKVQFISETLAWTEAPKNISQLGKQRVRWFRGALQALVKHRKLLFGKGNFTFKWLMLPYIWISDVIGVWVEVAAWIYTAYLLLTDAPMDWVTWAFIWAVIMVGHYINTLMVLAFVKQKLGVPYRKVRRGMVMSFFEGCTYHFLYVYWLTKAHIQQVFGIHKKWNKLERVGIKS